MAFSYYETVIAFYDFFTEDGKLVRTILEGGRIHDQSGEPLSIESDHESIADWIEEMVEYLTGFRLFSLTMKNQHVKDTVLNLKRRERAFYTPIFKVIYLYRRPQFGGRLRLH